jgi:putative DNA primase/helicase
MSDAPTARQAAIALAKLGLKVFPLHSINDDGACTCGNPGCNSPGKHPFAPLAPHGYKGATCDVPTIESWFDEHYWLNYGVCTDGLIVVDIDKDKGGAKTWHDISTLPTRAVPHTWRVLTGGGGEHIIFRHNGTPIKCNAEVLGRGVDIRSTGGYVCGVRCRHKSGRTYKWSPQCSPDEGCPLETAPDWLINVLKVNTHCGRVIAPHEWRKIAREPVEEGSRNTIILKLTGHLATHGIDEEVARDIMLGWNLGRCLPPLSDNEVVTIIVNIFERERAKHRWLTLPIGNGGDQ